MASAFNGVKVFSATMFADRDQLGEKCTAWLTSQLKQPGFELIEIKQTQSSDQAFHCVALTVFYKKAT